MSQKPSAKTLQVFLPHGTPSGIRIAELTTRIVQAIACPRTLLGDFFARPEVQHVGTYFLLGGSDDDAKPEVYIGQTEDLAQRLKAHDANKEFWHTVVVLVSRTHSFTQAHIKWLEWKAIAEAKKANRYRLANGNAGGEPFTTESMQADLEEVLETGALLLEALGHPLFRPLLQSGGGESGEGDSGQEWFLKGPDAEARGLFTNDGFVVREGSLCRKKVVDSAKNSAFNLKRSKMLESGVLVEDGNHFRFTEDTIFQSPSGAAISVLGRHANGWKEWKNSKGETLDEVKRQGEGD